MELSLTNSIRLWICCKTKKIKTPYFFIYKYLHIQELKQSLENNSIKLVVNKYLWYYVGYEKIFYVKFLWYFIFFSVIYPYFLKLLYFFNLVLLLVLFFRILTILVRHNLKRGRVLLINLATYNNTLLLQNHICDDRDVKILLFASALYMLDCYSRLYHILLKFCNKMLIFCTTNTYKYL